MDARTRLQRLVADPSADPAAVALATSAFHHRDLDVATALLRVDALTDVVRTSDGDGRPADEPTTVDEVAARLRDVLAARLGYRGAPTTPRRAHDAHLHVVLDQHHGLPVTLAALHVAVARRLGVSAYVVNLPGHVVYAVGDGNDRVVLDAYGGARRLDETAQARIVERATRGRTDFHRAMVRPASPADLSRRILANLTVDLTREQHPGAAVWTVVARLALPGADLKDHVVLGSLLEQSGRFVRAARAYDRYLEAAPDADDADDVRARARRSRARTN